MRNQNWQRLPDKRMRAEVGSRFPRRSRNVGSAPSGLLKRTPGTDGPAATVKADRGGNRDFEVIGEET